MLSETELKNRARAASHQSGDLQLEHEDGETGRRKSRSSVVKVKRRSVAPDHTHNLSHKKLRLQEYLLIVIEASLAVTELAIHNRNFEERYETHRQMEIYKYYICGYSSLLTLLVGIIAESWLSLYTMAFISVVIEFAAICVILTEEIIKTNQVVNPYAGAVQLVNVFYSKFPLPFIQICQFASVLIHSTAFTRIAFGLQGLVDRTKNVIFLFIFLQFWVSNHASHGGIIANAGSWFFHHYNVDLFIVSFILCGVSLFLFVYLLDPLKSEKEYPCLGCKILGCLILGTYYKICRCCKRKKNRGFFENTEKAISKSTIAKTKEMLKLLAMLMACLGIAFYDLIRGQVFYGAITQKIQTPDFIKGIGLQQMSRVVSSISMLVAYFILWPLLKLTRLIKERQNVKFITGHVLALSSLMFAGLVMRSLERFQYHRNTAFLMIFNARDSPVNFMSADLSFTDRNFVVPANQMLYQSFTTQVSILLPVKINFTDLGRNFTIFLAIVPGETVGYVMLEPPKLARIPGPFLPLRKIPPLTDDGSWSLIFITNYITTSGSITIIIRDHDNHSEQQELHVRVGVLEKLFLKPSRYDFIISQARITVTSSIEEGALYGFVIYLTTKSRNLKIFPVTPGNTTNAWLYLGIYCLMGLAFGLAYPALRAMIFMVSPPGLLAMSFAFLSFLESISMWIAYAGFITWHRHVTSQTLFTYTCLIAIFLFLVILYFVKFNRNYTF